MLLKVGNLFGGFTNEHGDFPGQTVTVYRRVSTKKILNITTVFDCAAAHNCYCPLFMMVFQRQSEYQWWRIINWESQLFLDIISYGTGEPKKNHIIFTKVEMRQLGTVQLNANLDSGTICSKHVPCQLGKL